MFEPGFLNQKMRYTKVCRIFWRRERDFAHTRKAADFALARTAGVLHFSTFKSGDILLYVTAFGAERGIRTPGSFHFNGFQDRRIRPLCHPSILLSCNLAGRKPLKQFDAIAPLANNRYYAAKRLQDRRIQPLLHLCTQNAYIF